MNSIYGILVIVCWAAFVLLWFGGWVYNLAKAPKGERTLPTAPVWIVGIGIVFVLVRPLHLHFWSQLQPGSFWLKDFGVAVLIPSTALVIWARLTLGMMWSGRVEAKNGHILVTRGAYQITRHPIYTGTIGVLLGSILTTGAIAWVALLIVSLISIIVKVPLEEKLMLETFGDEYRRYSARVRRIVRGYSYFEGVSERQTGARSSAVETR